MGWTHDSTALRYSCQTREIIRNITGEKIFLRHGDFWYRNPEFGRDVSDPDKRGRYGRQNKEGFKFNEFNPYHYHGEGYLGVNDNYNTNAARGVTEGVTEGVTISTARSSRRTLRQR